MSCTLYSIYRIFKKITAFMVFVGSIWKSKSGWFLFVMTSRLSVATEFCYCWGPSLIFNPSFAENQPCMTPQGQWNSSLPIQWCLLDPYGRVRVVGSCVLCRLGCQWPQKFCWLLGSISDHHWFSSQVLLKINPAWHHRSNETLPCPYSGVCWIHMEE
jgi:hypothetical protein